jgi:hypothetical protein
MKKFIKISLTILAVSALVLGLACVLSAKTINYYFANEGKLICFEHRDWGIFGKGNLTCKGLVDIVQTPVVTPVPEPTEIILKTK